VRNPNPGQSILSIRKTIIGILSLLAWAVLIGPLSAHAQSAPPRIFFTDLISGPNSGGESVSGFSGAYVTIYGNFLGSSQGSSTVTLNGASCLRVVSWGTTYLQYQKIVVQLGSSCASGPFAVTTSAGASNTDQTFTVQSGHIYCVSNSGNDSSSGAFPSSCWATIVKAKNTIAAGDIAYIENGVSQTSQDAFTACLSIQNNGSSGSPMALVAYPGATVTVGGAGNSLTAIRVPNLGLPASHWVIAGMTFLSGGTSAFSIGGVGSTDWRVIGNYISCPSGNGETGCFNASLASNIYFYGNEVTNTGVSGASKQYHSVYFTTDTNHVWCAWNAIHNNNTCREIQFHSSPLCSPSCGSGDTTGFDQYDLHVHDNLIHDGICDGINFATVDPSKGTVEAYNNVIYSEGKGPDPPDGFANYACIYSPGYTNNGTSGSGAVLVSNNTLYDCGARGGLNGGGNGAIGSISTSNGLSMQLKDNIVYQNGSEPYLESGATSLAACDHNLWFGGGSAPSQCSASVTSNPSFVSLGSDFHLQSGSPAINAGVNTGVSTDKDGLSRPQGSAYTLGAYEFFTGSSKPPQRPASPTNLKVVIQ
jgi:hypothetical protein